MALGISLALWDEIRMRGGRKDVIMKRAGVGGRSTRTLTNNRKQQLKSSTFNLES